MNLSEEQKNEIERKLKEYDISFYYRNSLENANSSKFLDKEQIIYNKCKKKLDSINQNFKILVEEKIVLLFYFIQKYKNNKIQKILSLKKSQELVFRSIEIFTR